MKVLFIDDEPLIRKGLQVIIPWADYGFTEFFEAEDGTEGLQIIEKENPELVMLDIQMEKMSGLSLAKTARENDFNGRIIILSGYSDFSYAKTAISYNVTAYLLKPVDPKMLIEAVEKALDELQKEQLVSIFSEQSTGMSQNNILSGILLGKMTYTREMQSLYHISLDSDYYRLLSLFCSKDILKSLDDLKELQKKHLTVDMDEGGLVFITTSLSQFQTLKKQLDSIFAKINITDEPVMIISSVSKNHGELSRIYAENYNVYQNIYYYKNQNERMIYAENCPQVSEGYSSSDSNPIALTEEMLEQILLLNDKAVSELTAKLSSLLIQRRPPRDSINFMLLNCYTQIIDRLIRYYPALEFELADKAKFTNRLYNDRYLCQSIDYLTKQLLKAVSYIADASQASPVERICSYIDANYASPLKLESIAELFGYNSAYLGKLFARETGCHFNTYLDNIRIKRAKEFLEKGVSVTQTCELAGFSNTDYFTKKFKKYEGMLPSEYRKKYSSD